MADPDLREIERPETWATATQINIRPSGNTTHLPELPPTLRFLEVTKNKLVELPSLPANLENLNVEGNVLTKIPKLPDRLARLNIKNNQITSIPTPIPSSLQNLGVTRNQISVIPSLTGTEVREAGLGFNQLTALPAFPNTLRELGCSNNQLTEIRSLPDRLNVLNCSNNCLRVLEIQNLKWLRVLIANNCCLTEIPLLPPMFGDENNGGNNNGGAPEEEDHRQYYFEGNPLTPEFAAIYNRYKQAGGAHSWQRERGSTRRFREQVLEEHRRLIASRKASATVIQQALKGPGGPFGNYGPANLIAEFITGKKGTTEMQRLALLENQERLGAVPKGAAERARKKIADVALGRSEQIGPITEQQNYLAKRARLYLKKENIANAEQRLKEKIEKLDLDRKKKDYLYILGKLILQIRLLKNEALHDIMESELALQQRPDWTEEKQRVLTGINQNETTIIDWLYPDQYPDHYHEISLNKETTQRIYDYMVDIKNSIGEYPTLRDMVGKTLKENLVSVLLMNRPADNGSILIKAAKYPQWFEANKTGPFLEEQRRLINEMVDLERRFMVSGSKDEMDELLDIFMQRIKKFDDNMGAISEAPAEANPEEEAVVAAIAEWAVGEDDNEGEALPHAIAAALEEAENELENEEEVLENNNNLAPGGGRRRRRTPRKHKGKRHTRKH